MKEGHDHNGQKQNGLSNERFARFTEPILAQEDLVTSWSREPHRVHPGSKPARRSGGLRELRIRLSRR